MKLMWLAPALLVAGTAFAQEGKQISYEFTDVRVDDPEVFLGAGVGLYLPGLAGWEVLAMGNDVLIPGLWGDFRYVSSTGLLDDNTLLSDSTEAKVRVGYGIQNILKRDTSVVLDSQTWESGDKRYTKTTYFKTEAPGKEATIVYGLLSQRNHVKVTEGEDGKDDESERLTSTMVGLGVRFQNFENFQTKVKDWGDYHNNDLEALEFEVMQGDKGVFKGTHWYFAYDVMFRPWYFNVGMGTGLTGLDDKVEILDTLAVKVSMGWAFETNINRTETVWDAKCWSEKRDIVACKK